MRQLALEAVYENGTDSPQGSHCAYCNAGDLVSALRCQCIEVEAERDFGKPQGSNVEKVGRISFLSGWCVRGDHAYAMKELCFAKGAPFDMTPAERWTESLHLAQGRWQLRAIRLLFDRWRTACRC